MYLLDYTTVEMPLLDVSRGWDVSHWRVWDVLTGERIIKPGLGLHAIIILLEG
jgi:hypothetical protein